MAEPVVTRESWDMYFMKLAEMIASRGTCLRKKVGCVLVRNNRIIATGYNGSPPRQPHCLDVGCEMEDGHCVRTVHAEANAILQAAGHGVSLDGVTCYTTASPCYICAKQLVSIGCTKVVFGEPYREDNRAIQLFESSGCIRYSLVLAL